MSDRQRSDVVHHLAILALFVVLTLVVTYPLPLRLSTHLAGDDYDVWARPWATWWTRKAISEGHALYETDMLFHPHGVSLVYHSFSHANTALALLMEPLVGVVAAHNLTVLLAFVLSGYGMALLVRDLTRSEAAGVVAGLIFAFSTYHVDQSSHLIILSTQWLPLWMLSVTRILRNPPHERWHIRLLAQAGLAALFLVLTALSSWHLLIFSALWMAVYLFHAAVWERVRLGWTNLSAFLVMGVVALLVVSPLLLPLVQGRLSDGGRQWLDVPIDEAHSTDVLAFFIPSRRHPIIGALVESIQDRIGRRQVFLGYVTLALAVVGALKGRRRARVWTLATVIFFTISLGAYVRFNGMLLSIGSRRGPLQPWLIPFTELIRDPTRLTAMTMLGIAVLAGFGIAWLRDNGPAFKSPVVLALLSAVILFEFLPWPFPTTKVEGSSFFEGLGRSEEFFALADIPIHQLEIRRLSMFHQITHQKPIVEGIVGRTPPDAYRFIEEHPLLSAFDADEPTKDPSEIGDDVSHHLDRLAEANVRYLVLHRRFLTPEQIQSWDAYLPFEAAFQDEHITVYETEPRLGQRLRVLYPVNETLGLSEVNLRTRFPHAGAQLSLDAAWAATSSPDAQAVTWSLLAEDGRVVAETEGEVCRDASVDDWRVGDFGWGRYRLNTDVAPGPYRLHVRLEPVGDERDVGSVLILPREGPRGDAAAPPFASFGERIVLDDLRLIPGDAMLHVDVRWRALVDLSRDYKLFVHLVDGNGKLMDQVDTMPRDWTAPTSTWQESETLRDLVSLDTFGLPAGTYQVNVGLYDAATGDRLSVQLPSGERVADGTLVREVRLP